MNIINFLIENWDSVLLVIAVAATLVFLWYRGNKKIVFKILYCLVTEAEKVFGGGTGSLKQATVFTQIYEKLPKIFRTFISAATLEKWIDEALVIAKKKWETNGYIGEYISNKG
jgi:hypothetical protein